jgi:5-methylcytosine-specific restriction endonuclease McrA
MSGVPMCRCRRHWDYGIIGVMADELLPRAVIIERPDDAVPGWLGKPAQGDGTCRGGYGLAVVERYGARCAYCDRDLAATYESWLDLSVDHVVPRNGKSAGIPDEWIEDLHNHVPCCRACNEFLNGFRVTVAVPDDIAGFLALRESILEAKRIHALKRHRTEREKFDTWRRTREDCS